MTRTKAALEAAATTEASMTVDELILDINQKKIYPGTQQNLYSYSGTIWNSYLSHLSDFTTYRSAFDQRLGEDALAFIAETEAMPSFEALRGEHNLARNQLIMDNDAVLGQCRTLFDYIGKAYSATDLPGQLAAAGKGYYKEASDLQWDKTATMIRMSTTFMREKGAKLMENGNMPDSFPDAFKLVADTFTAQRSLFKEKESQARLGILSKAAANNTIYSALVEVTKSADTIYRKNKVVLWEFTVSRVLKTVRGNSPSGIKGGVYLDQNRKKPLSNVLVYDKNDPERFARTGTDGRYELKYPSGVLTAVFELEGYLPQEITKQITVGTMSPTFLVLSPVPVEAPAIESPNNSTSEMLNSAMTGLIKEEGEPVTV